MKKNKITKADTIVPVAILALTLLFVGICIFEQSGIKFKQNDNYVIQKKEFKDIDVSIAFRTINTSEEDYEILKNNCADYINNNDTITTNVDTNVTITENTYIDTNGKVRKDNKDDTMHETGPVYLKDKVLVRYINEKGEMKVAASKMVYTSLFSEDCTYETVGSENLGELFLNRNDNIELLNNIYIDNNIDNSRFTGTNIFFKGNIVTNEDSYLRDISNIFLDIIKESSIDDIDTNLKEKALGYFTYDGYVTMIEGISDINLNNESSIVSFIEAGRSDLDCTYKDRVIMQIKTMTDDCDICTNIIIKLDNDYKIFDIDII